MTKFSSRARTALWISLALNSLAITGLIADHLHRFSAPGLTWVILFPFSLTVFLVMESSARELGALGYLVGLAGNILVWWFLFWAGWSFFVWVRTPVSRAELVDRFGEEAVKRSEEKERE